MSLCFRVHRGGRTARRRALQTRFCLANVLCRILLGILCSAAGIRAPWYTVKPAIWRNKNHLWGNNRDLVTKRMQAIGDNAGPRSAFVMHDGRWCEASKAMEKLKTTNEVHAPAHFPQRRAMPLALPQPSFPTHPNHNIFPKMRASFHVLSG